MRTCQVEHWEVVRDEAAELWPAHFDEVGQGKEYGWALSPDLDVLQRLAANGKLHIVTVRENGRLVGYHASIVEPLLHYREILAGKSDLYWLHPDCRNGRTAVQLFLEVERTLRRRGVRVLFDGYKLAQDHSRLFAHLGYSSLEMRVTKVL